MKYLLLFCGKPHKMEAWEALPDETRAQHARRMEQWVAEHRSHSVLRREKRWPCFLRGPIVVIS